MISIKSFCIMSGGVDSALAAYKAKRKYNDVTAVFFDWGQKAVGDEKKAVDSICKAISIKDIKVIKIPISEWDRSELTKGNKTKIMNPRNIIVPERNLIFIAMAASFARTEGGGKLIVGFNKDDAGYDTSIEFVKELNRIFKIGNGGFAGASDRKMRNSQIKVVAPLIKKDKKYIIAKLRKLRLLDKTYSCYAANGPCGKCPACKKRESGKK